MKTEDFARLETIRAAAIGVLTMAEGLERAELDVGAWLLTGERVRAGGAAESEARWFAIQALASTTLGWLEFYRSDTSDLPMRSTW